MNVDTSKGNKNSESVGKNTDAAAATHGSVMYVGDTPRDITDTGDVAGASIAKGKGVQKNRTAADITKGQIESDESVIQGAAAATKITTTPKITEEDTVSKDKVVSSGTSFKEDKSIDKANIYSTEDAGTRYLDKVQQKPAEKVEDKEKGSWRIEEEGGEVR